MSSGTDTGLDTLQVMGAGLDDATVQKHRRTAALIVTPLLAYLGFHLLTPLGRPPWLLIILWKSVLLFRIAWAAACVLGGIAFVTYIWKRGCPEVPRGPFLVALTVVTVLMIGISQLVVEDEMDSLTAGVKESRWDRVAGQMELDLIAREHMARAGGRGAVRMRITLEVTRRSRSDDDQRLVLGPVTRSISPREGSRLLTGSRRVMLLETVRVPFSPDVADSPIWFYPQVRATPLNGKGEAIGPETISALPPLSGRSN